MRHPNPALNRFIDSLEGIVERERDRWKVVAAVEPLVKQLIADPDRSWLKGSSTAGRPRARPASPPATGSTACTGVAPRFP